MTTPQELLENQRTIANKSENDLLVLTVPQLRKLYQSVHVSAVNDATGKIVKVSDATKAVLIAGLIEYIESLRGQMAITYDEDAVKADEIELDSQTESDLHRLVESLVKDYVAILNLSYDAMNDKWKSNQGKIALLAGRFREFVFLNYSGKEQYHTRVNVRTKLFSRLKKQLENQFRNTNKWQQIETDLNDLNYFLKLAFKEDSALKKTHQIESKKQRNKNRIVINVDRLLDRANEVVNNLDRHHWIDVVLAVVLLSGRRPYSEVLIDTDIMNFDPSNTPNHLLFTGQAKDKGNDRKEYYRLNPTYEIPVLCDPSLLIAAKQKLKDSNKLVGFTEVERESTDDIEDIKTKVRARSNDRHSKDVSKRFKNSWLPLIDVITDSEEPKSITPHTLRAFYSILACKRFRGTNEYDLYYAAKILGHAEVDTTTVQNYQKDFEIVD